MATGVWFATGCVSIYSGWWVVFDIAMTVHTLAQRRAPDQEERFTKSKKARHAEAQKRYRQKAKLPTGDGPY